MDGVFGSAEPVTDQQVDEADLYLGYTAGHGGANVRLHASEAPEEPQDGAESAGEGDSSSEGSSGAPAASGDDDGRDTKQEDEQTLGWEQERAQYQQAIQAYEQTIAQLLQMFQTNPYAQQGPQLLPGQ